MPASSQPAFETHFIIREILSITDIHVQDGQRISISAMEAWLPGYMPFSRRSYAFFGNLWSDLPERLLRAEAGLIAARAPNGLHVGAVWRQRS